MNNEELKKLYSVAKIYWHATGMGMLETENPLEQEHFGITTVEAMNYGVVPVVVNQGGQPEIVQHGTDGFLWNDICECINYTKNLIENEEKRENMAKAAAISARRFSLEQFEKKLVHYLEEIFDAKENMER
ncbi:MAG: glycosyltransferase [Lachnospiraceae bacterium]|nr:glycosyltransferase [Lachnospiraceae bacterium]